MNIFRSLEEVVNYYGCDSTAELSDFLNHELGIRLGYYTDDRTKFLDTTPDDDMLKGTLGVCVHAISGQVRVMYPWMFFPIPFSQWSEALNDVSKSLEIMNDR